MQYADLQHKLKNKKFSKEVLTKVKKEICLK
jgi:hypothetical protein